MEKAWMDLIGMYNHDNTILSELEIPKEDDAFIVDPQTLKDNILLETAELEVIYPNPDFMRVAIGIWSRKQAPVWLELWKTTQYEYNPIWNKDGTIKETITRNLAGSENRTEDYTRTDNLKTDQDITRTDDLHGTVDTTLDSSVYGFNSSSPSPSDKSVEDTDTSNTGTSRNAGSISNTGTVRNAGRTGIGTTDTGTISTDRTEQGNIGVTSTQQLIKEQREVVELNIMNVIIDDFKKRFCLLVY